MFSSRSFHLLSLSLSFSLSLALPLLISCTSTVLDDSAIDQKHQTQVNLLLDFTTPEAPWSTRATDPESATVPDGFPSGPSSFTTRALTATASEVSRIALSIFDAAGNKALEKSQYKTDDDFGTFADLRLLPGGGRQRRHALSRAER